MTYLTLHLRARRVPAAATVALATSAGAWLAWVLVSDTRQIGAPLAEIALMLACVAAAVTFSGDDEALDRTAAFAWPRVRALHLLTVFGLLIALFSVTLITPAQFGPFSFMVRDAAGLLGLTALGAVLLGTQRAWFVPVGWSAITVFWGGPSSNPGMQVLAWMTQPSGATASTITALALAVIGGGAYVHGRAGLPRTENL